MTKVVRTLVALVATTLLASTAAAQGFPNKPIRFIVPYPPGGGTDIVARLIAPKMAEKLGQPVLIDNKPGASTIIGTEILAKSAPDGYTIALLTDSHTINPFIFKQLPYDSHKDFRPVTQLVFVPLMLIAHPSLQAKTLQDIINSEKAKSGKLNYASIGSGSPHFLAMEWLKQLSGINATNIPYKGVAPAVSDVVGGQVDIMFTGMSSALPHVRAGKLVGVAVSSAKRQPSTPEIPSVAETPGLAEFDFMTWYGVFAPAGTPEDIVARLSAEIADALNQPDVKERLASLGVVGAPSKPDAFAKFMEVEAKKLERIVKLAGVKPE